MLILIYLGVIIGGLVLLVFALSLIGHKRYEKRVEAGIAQPDETSPFEVTQEVPEDCCGQHATCERDSLLAAVSKEIIYYDDEELDRFAGREAEAYSMAEADEFRDIFYELREVEVAGWVRSLQLRQINLPAQVMDEVMLVVCERRFQSVGAGEADHSNDKVGSNMGKTKENNDSTAS